MIPKEEDEQIAFVSWCRFNNIICHHCANEIGGSTRALKLRAIKAKKMGTSKGFPDLLVFVPIKNIYDDVKLDDNMFEVALARINNKADMLKMLVLVSTVDVKKIPGVKYYRTNHLELEFLNGPKTSWCIDGEEYKSMDMKYEFNVKQDMKMLVPKENIKKLFDE